MKRPRAGGLLATALLHGAALGGLAFLTPQRDARMAPRAALASVRLIAAAAPAAVPAAAPALPARQHRAAAPAPAAAAPAVPAQPAEPAVTVAVAMAADTPSAAATTAAPSAPAQAAPPAEADYHAAVPADRQCAALNMARHYPPMLRERGIEGRVLLRVRVDEQGRATEIRVQDGSGFRLLDEAAQRLTQGCRFLPARRGEQSLASWVEYPVRFALSLN